MEPTYNEQPYLPPRFTATVEEKLAAIVSFPAAYLYICFFLEWNSVYLTVFALVFCLGVALMHQKRQGGWEPWVWLGAMAVCLGAILLDRNRVWDTGLAILFIHGFAVYYCLCRADVLLEGRTSHLLPLDALYGVIIFPFGRFFLRIRVLVAMIRDGRKQRSSSLLWTLVAILAAVALLCLAGKLLSRADEGFAKLMLWLRLPEPGVALTDFLLRLLLSLPVGAYLYGLVAGAGRVTPEEMRTRGQTICHNLEKLRRVPNAVWLVLLAAFVLLYGVFFGVQGSYLFGAFTRTLPEGFTVAEYARQGFFALCKVMALTFVLLWLALRSAGKDQSQSKPLRIMATALLGESMLLAVTAASKLWLYIDCFGFTPLRLQSAWLIAVLFMGCVASLWSLWTGRRSVRAWAMLSGISLALLHLY